MLISLIFSIYIFYKLLFQHIFFLSTNGNKKKAMLMFIIIMKNVTNNSMYTAQELHIFA